MKHPPNFARFSFLLIALLAILCIVAAVRYQPVAALAFNGKIAFGTGTVIFTINPDGLGLQQLTPFGNGFTDRYPAWSPDGTKIAFSRSIFSVQSQIYVMNADGSNPTRITNNSAADSQPTWSPDGTRIAFVSTRDGNNELYVMNADGSNQIRLTNDPGFDMDPAWSPNGTKIAFASTRDHPDINGNGAFELYTIGADGSNTTRLTNNTADDRDPSWSPDGSKLSFGTQRDGLPLIYVMNADGSNPINITMSTTLDSGDPVWSPDGTTIAFTSFARVGLFDNQIFLINADGSNIRPLTNLVFGAHELAWQPLASAPRPTPTPTPTPTPSPSPIPTYKISGTVTDNNGQPLAGVTMILVSNAVATQIVFTDQAGNYVFTYEHGSSSLTVTPSKAGYSFNPLSIGFVASFSVSGDQTASFAGTATPLALVQIPILLTRDKFQHAFALDSVLLTGEPFGVGNTLNFSTDHRTRVSLFALNIDLGTNENLSAITAEAEDSLGAVFQVPVESFAAVPNFPWLKQVIVKLPDEIANKIEVRVRIKVRNFTSNKVIVKVRP